MAAAGKTGLLVLSVLLVLGRVAPLSSYLTNADIERFKNIFLQPSNDDLGELESSVYGLTILGIPLPEPEKICETVKKNVDAENVESIFRAVYISSTLKAAGKPCELAAQLGSVEAKLRAAITTDASTKTVFQATKALSLLGLKIDAAQVTAALEAGLKADDSPLSYSCVFYAAVYLPTVADMKKFHDMIEDIVAQADEIDEKYLQFEGGLVPTTTVLYTAYKLSEQAKLAPPIAEDKVVKFANYLLSRRHTQSKTESMFLVSAIVILTNNQFHVPVVVSLASPVAVTAKSPTVQVRVCNLLGKSLGKLTVTADTARHVSDDAVVLSKKSFTSSAADDSVYELGLMSVNPKRGFYRILVSVVAATPSKAKLLGGTGAEVEVKVTTQVVIDNVELSVADKDQSSVPKANKLSPPSTVSIEADHHQRILLKFSVKEEASKQPITAHQTFVRLTNAKTKQEVIFVAEEEAGSYKFDLDVGARSKDFKNLAGKYTMDLIVGDAVIENPITWTLANVQLTFQEDPILSTSNQFLYAKKPDINHLFREPEKRPPVTVSNLFTALVLLPLLILFALWIKLGANISNFKFSLSALGFHIGLSAIFALYLGYFLHLNMFETLRYLALIGIPTFLFGNRLLSSIAARSWNKHKEH